MLRIVAAALSGAGLVLSGWAALELRASFQLLRRRAHRIRHLVPGPAEVAGTIRAADGQPFMAASGVPIVAGVGLVEARGRRGARRLLERRVHHVRATIADSGDLCDVDLQGAEVLAEAWEKSDGHMVHTELVVPDGAFVVVSGFARVARGADDHGRERRTIVHGTPDRPLVVSVGGQPSAIFRHDGRAVAALAAGLVLELLAGAVVLAELWLEAL